MNTLDYPVAANHTDPHWEDLTVTAYMAEPIVGVAEHLALDGLLSWGAYLAYVEEHGDDLPPMTPAWAVDFDLPLARWAAPAPTDGLDPRLLTPDGDVWGWCASRVQTGIRVLYTRVDVRRKPATERMSAWSNAKSHHIGLGPLKARNAAHGAVFVPSVTWHCRGDRAGIDALLGRVTHIGKLHKHGNGRVLRWEVTDGPVGGWTDRPTPHPAGTPQAVRPPHHHRSRLVPCR